MTSERVQPFIKDIFSLEELTTDSIERLEETIDKIAERVAADKINRIVAGKASVIPSKQKVFLHPSVQSLPPDAVKGHIQGSNFDTGVTLYRGQLVFELLGYEEGNYYLIFTYKGLSRKREEYLFSIQANS